MVPCNQWQWGQTEIQESPSENEKTILFCKGGQILANFREVLKFPFSEKEEEQVGKKCPLQIAVI